VGYHINSLSISIWAAEWLSVFVVVYVNRCTAYRTRNDDVRVWW
jgi:hypothetical protein